MNIKVINNQIEQWFVNTTVEKLNEQNIIISGTNSNAIETKVTEIIDQLTNDYRCFTFDQSNLFTNITFNTLSDITEFIFGGYSNMSDCSTISLGFIKREFTIQEVMRTYINHFVIKNKSDLLISIFEKLQNKINI